MSIPRAYLVGTACGLILGGCVSAVKTAPEGDSTQAAVYRGLVADSVVAGWPQISALAARRLIERYGVPDAVRGDSLIWHRNGPWKRTAVRDVTPPYVQPEDLGVIEQTIDYPLTSRQAGDIAKFDRRVAYDSSRRELSVRSDREEGNFLRLNLADDIANGRTTSEQARALHAQILRLEAAGKESSYLQVLKFPH